MRGVGALLAIRLDQPPFDQAVQQHVEDQPGQVVLDEPGPELRQHTEVEPRIIQLQPEAVLPVDPSPYRLAGLPIGQVAGKLQRCRQRQLPRRQPRPPTSRERRREPLVTEQLAQLVADPHSQCRPRERCTGHFRRQRRNLGQPTRPHRHHGLHLLARPGRRIHAAATAMNQRRSTDATVASTSTTALGGTARGNKARWEVD